MFSPQKLLAIITLALIAVMVSPSDIVSTLLIGLPNCVLFALAFKYFASDSRRHAGPAA